jgi:hypothetical protein
MGYQPLWELMPKGKKRRGLGRGKRRGQRGGRGAGVNRKNRLGIT